MYLYWWYYCIFQIINERNDRQIYGLYNDEFDNYKRKSFGWNIGDINPNYILNGLPNYNLISLINLFIPINDIEDSVIR